jgi:hypothetical protein
MEGAVFIAACLALAWFHVVLFQNSGSVWRDETGAIQIASAPSWTDLWSWLSRDSAPVAFYAALRAWMSGTAWAAKQASVSSDCWFPRHRRVVVDQLPDDDRSCTLGCRGLGSVQQRHFLFLCFGASLRACGPVHHALLRGRLAARAASDPENRPAALLLAMLACHTIIRTRICCWPSASPGDGLRDATAVVSRPVDFGIGFAVAVSLLVYVPAIRDFENRAGL